MTKQQEILNELYKQSEGDLKDFVELVIKNDDLLEFTEDDVIQFLVDCPAKIIEIVEALVKYSKEQQDCIKQAKELVTSF